MNVRRQVLQRQNGFRPNHKLILRFRGRKGRREKSKERGREGSLGVTSCAYSREEGTREGRGQGCGPFMCTSQPDSCPL